MELQTSYICRQEQIMSQILKQKYNNMISDKECKLTSAQFKIQPKKQRNSPLTSQVEDKVERLVKHTQHLSQNQRKD